MSPRPTILASMALALSGCLQRSLPIPPPSVQSIVVRDCDAATCGAGVTGAVVDLSGEGYSDGILFVVDLTQAQMGGGPRGEVPGAVASITATGQWHVTVGPVRDGAGVVHAVQRGDVLEVYQVTAAPDSELSSSRFVTVPRCNPDAGVCARSVRRVGVLVASRDEAPRRARW